MPAQPRPVRATGIRFVGQYSLRPYPRPPTTDLGDLDFVEHGRELRTISCLTRRDQQRQHSAALFACQMQLRRPATPRPTQTMISRLELTLAARWLGLGGTVTTGSCGVLVGAHDRRVHTHLPADRSRRVGEDLQHFHDQPPPPAPLPPPEQPIDRRPGPVLRRHVAPGAADPGPPPDPVDELPFGPHRRAARLLRSGQQRHQPRPLGIGQVGSPGHRYAGHEVCGTDSGLLGR